MGLGDWGAHSIMLKNYLWLPVLFLLVLKDLTQCWRWYAGLLHAGIYFNRMSFRIKGYLG